MNAFIYHITSRKEWQAGQDQKHYSPPSLLSEGFIHCSRWEQVARVANLYYQGQSALVLLEIDPERLVSAIRWEPGTDKPDELFPHIYGDLNPDAVLRVLEFPPGINGLFSMPTTSENSFNIRPALPADVQSAVPLLRLSMGAETDWLFGQERDHPANEVMGSLFVRKHNRASFDACWLVERDGMVQGLLLAFPGKLLRQRNLWTGWQLMSIFGLPATIRLAGSQRVYGDLVEALPDEFYVSNMAVDPGCQGGGIGARMLSFCDEQAAKMGYGKCSLIVTYDNPARRLYERCGYQVVHSFDVPHPVIAHGSGGYHRMLKIIQQT